ncbi:shikimate dehydrogenase [Thermodesulfobacteriota bacterium]
MLCIPVISETTEQALADMEAAGRLADLVEVRLDYVKNPDLPRIIAARPKPLIITITPASENGQFRGTEAERIALLEQAIDLGADYVDINLDCAERDRLIKNCKGTRVIVSYHNYNETPQDLEAIHSRIQATGADIIKIATRANRLEDNFRVLAIAQKSEKDTIALCMGELGEISRILAPLHGAYLTFASLSPGRESAPGQIPAETMHNIYGLQKLQPGCTLYGLIGNPVSKSRGYILFNRLFRRSRMNSLYLNFPVQNLDEFMHSIAPRLAGFSITMPHKQAVMAFLDDIDPLAKKIGAVNTVVNSGGRLIGYNTDLAGALKPIQARTPVAGRRVTLLGAGGAARAIAVGIIAAGGKLTILNRTVAKARALADELGCGAGPLADFPRTETDILINMTSVGMHPRVAEAPVDTALVKNMTVLDGIYNPEKTLLLQKAEENGCSSISGLEMFITQAAEQLRLWTAREADTGLMREILTCS